MTVNESDFPKLKQYGYRVTSEPDERYNCIAWAVGENHRWWEPCDGRYWPGRNPGDEPNYSVSGLVAACEAVGFVEC